MATSVTKNVGNVQQDGTINASKYGLKLAVHVRIAGYRMKESNL